MVPRDVLAMIKEDSVRSAGIWFLDRARMGPALPRPILEGTRVSSQALGGEQLAVQRPDTGFAAQTSVLRRSSGLPQASRTRHVSLEWLKTCRCVSAPEGYWLKH